MPPEPIEKKRRKGKRGEGDTLNAAPFQYLPLLLLFLLLML